MKMLFAFVLAILVTAGPAAREVQRYLSSSAMLLPGGPPTNRHAVPGQQSTADVTAKNRALLDSLGEPPETTWIREYVPRNGGFGRQYASELPLEDAAAAATVFYREKLLAQGWEEIERHAAISGFLKGNQLVVMARAGAQDPGLPPGAQLLKKRTAPAGAKFYFRIDVEPKE